MNSKTDIRDKAYLTENEINLLNFISDLPTRHFRMHYRQGLRSHIFEVLNKDDVLKETEGEVVDGSLRFPRAVPQYMLRILRARFTSLDLVLDEVKRYSLILKYLGSDLIAKSEEFIVEYTGTGKSEIVLCGLQEYIQGEILDPWSLFGPTPLVTFYEHRFPGNNPEKKTIENATNAIATFVKQTRQMINDTGYIPDLAGNGNLIMTPGGGIKLVDINNIIRVVQNDTIALDDKNYPACDKSVEVLALFEQKIIEKENPLDDPLFQHFLSVDRKKIVSKLENKFFQSISSLSAL